MRVRESLKGCILSKFYIKPQQRVRHKIGHSCCILSKFYIKPQRPALKIDLAQSCILSKFYIKPQLLQSLPITFSVVSYRNSTSNHNLWKVRRLPASVVSYRNSTSNHNCIRGQLPSGQSCILSKFYIKPQRFGELDLSNHGCILSKFYIKPQLHGYGLARSGLYLIEILHQTTTGYFDHITAVGCILSKFYIKPQRRASY